MPSVSPVTTTVSPDFISEHATLLPFFEKEELEITILSTPWLVERYRIPDEQLIDETFPEIVNGSGARIALTCLAT